MASSEVGRGFLSVTALLLAGAFLAGCGDNCDELQDICDVCIDPNQRAACEKSVDEADQDACTVDIESYRDICQ